MWDRENRTGGSGCYDRAYFLGGRFWRRNGGNAADLGLALLAVDLSRAGLLPTLPIASQGPLGSRARERGLSIARPNLR